MVKVDRITCGNGNCFLVHTNGNAILVDTCRARFKDKIFELCRQHNVQLIVLTHGHIDHVQNAAFLSDKLNIPIAMHQADYKLIESNWHEPLSAHTLQGKFILKLSMRSFQAEKIEPFTPAFFLSEGDTLSHYGIPASILELSGHTKGSIGIRIDNTDLIVGDALMNMFYPGKTPLYGDLTAMNKSADRISKLGEMTIHFGHGRSVPNRSW